MADDMPDTGEPATEPAPGTGDQQQPGTGAPQGSPQQGQTPAPTHAAPDSDDPKWKALARKHEMQAKANLEALEAERAARAVAERDRLAALIALETGLPPELGELLKGDDETAIRAHADKLRKFSSATVAPQVGGPQGPPTNGRSLDEWKQLM